MKELSVFLVATGLVVAGCSNDVRTTTDLPSSPGLVAARGGPPQNACSFKDAKAFADDYFALLADRKTVGDLLKAAEAAPEGSSLRNGLLFDVFKQIESSRAVGQVGDAVHGANLILEADDCGKFFFSHRDPRSDLATVLTEALTIGAWAYRDADVGGFVATQDGGAALNTANWGEWIHGRSMVFGARFGITFPEAVVTNPNLPPPAVPFSYRFGLVYDIGTPGPSGSPDDIAQLELCDQSVTYLAKHRVGRLNSNGATLLQRSDQDQQEFDIEGFCDGVASLNRPSGFLARALDRVVGFFTPTPLQARRRAPPGMAGGIGELSDFVGADGKVVTLTLPTQPKNGRVGAAISFSARTVAAAGTPLENVRFVVTVDGNEGTNVALTGGCEPTNEAGNAACSVFLNKTGGYRLRVTADFTGLDPVFVITNLFNVKN